MTISELIQHLEKIKENGRGDHQVQFSVQDHFSKYGQIALPYFSTDGNLWTGVHSHNNTTTLGIYLQDRKDFTTGEIKHPKITFRK